MRKGKKEIKSGEGKREMMNIKKGKERKGKEGKSRERKIKRSGRKGKEIRTVC